MCATWRQLITRTQVKKNRDWIAIAPGRCIPMYQRWRHTIVAVAVVTPLFLLPLQFARSAALLKDQLPARSIKAIPKAQLPAHLAKVIPKDQPPAHLAKAIPKDQLPAHSVKAIPKDQPPAHSAKVITTDQLPAH